MNCPDCRHPNDPQRNFCSSCGGALALHCRACGFRNLTADRYCGGCGAPLQEAAAQTATDARAAAPAWPEEGDDELADLLAAAREDQDGPGEDADIRVDQGDIDSLFGD